MLFSSKDPVIAHKYEFMQVHHQIERKNTVIELSVKLLLESPDTVPLNFCTNNTILLLKINFFSFLPSSLVHIMLQNRVFP